MGEIYHAYNRGVEKRTIFQDDADRLRFIHDLFEFNDKEPASNTLYSFNKQSMEVEPRYIGRERKPRKLIVKIFAFCLMPNHFHLLLQQIKEGGISRFMQKLNTGYTMYFNKRYERTGHLFQGAYKSVRVANEAHLIHLPYYIHLNPLDLKFKRWRAKELENYNGAAKFLENYRWSSHLDYLGKKNFPSVTQRGFLMEFFGGPLQYQKEILQWLKEADLSEIEHLTLEK